MPVNKTKTKKIKDYEITGVVGKGGMGEVYLAKHPTLKRFIILKKLSIRDKEASERFLKEAKVMLEFRHENIVQIYDHFKEGGSTYIAMEYVKGKALNDIISENGKIPAELALFIIYQIAQGLYHAHSKKVIHRDIKPHNVLISTDGEVKLTDFGIAKSSDEKLDNQITSTGTVIGTPAYMSP
jgi:eukaryotic-like serine/threonine-protein kinase